LLRNLLVVIAWVAILGTSGCSFSGGRAGTAAYRRGDYREAMRLWLPLAENGDSRAQSQVAYLYERGLGVGKDWSVAADWYRKAADKGNPYARCSLGLLYEKSDPKESLRWHKLAAEQGESLSQWAVGRNLESRHDYPGAAVWLEKAANQQVPEAMLALARFYRDGRGVTRDPAAAARWALLAAESDLAEAHLMVARFYQQGQGLKRDSELATEYYGKAAALGSSPAAYELALIRLEQGQLQEIDSKLLAQMEKAAVSGDLRVCLLLGKFYAGEGNYSAKDAEKWLSKGARKGSAEAQFQLGKLYNQDSKVHDPQAAERWWLKASAQKHSEASVALGKLYARRGLANARTAGWITLAGEAGDIEAQLALVDLDPDRAEEWLKLAADQGSARAQLRLGNSMRDQRRYSDAVEWYRKAAAQDLAQANYALGRMLEEGLGVAQSDQEAMGCYEAAEPHTSAEASYALGRVNQKLGHLEDGFRWYWTASELGNSDADYALGLCYQDGKGVEANQDFALYCYKKAAQAGVPEACYAVGYMYENGLSRPADQDRAIEYYSRAQGMPEATAALQRLKGL
jgi:TPR repeat protein